MIKISDKSGVRIIEFNQKLRTNPFSNELIFDVIQALENASQDSAVKAVILTGGKDHSFSAGGDFKEVQLLKDGLDVQKWIDDVISLYCSVLNVAKPVLGAIDHHAIGIGFQLALMCDFRIGTPNTQFTLPELKGGIACSLGGFLLEKFFGRAKMQKIVYGCSPIYADQALEMELLNELTDSDLLDAAMLTAKKFISYPPLAFSATKRVLNTKLSSELRAFQSEITLSHIIAIENEQGQSYYKKILAKNEEKE